MGKKAVLKFFIYTFYAIAGIITLLLLCLPAWDNLDDGRVKVGVFLQDSEKGLSFGYMPNAKSNESTIYQMAVYTVIYVCIMALLNITLIGFTSLDSNKVAKWLHVIICCAHATGLVFLFLIYSIRYLIEFVPPLRNYYLDIFGILIDFILVLLLIMYKRKKNVDTGITDIKVDGDDAELGKINSKKSTIKKNNTKNPQLISEGIATPLYYGGNEIVEHQPTVKPTVDQSKIVVSDNVVNNETYIDGNGNQFQYNPTQPIEVATTYGPQPPVQSPVFNPINGIPQPIDPVQSPAFNPVNNNVNNNQPDNKHRLNSQYTFSESNPYPEAKDTIYNKIPEIPIIGKKEEGKK